MAERRQALLVNAWYAHPVGHAIEALHACLGYHLADPTLRISVVVNARTPSELARCCRFVEGIYTVEFDPFLDAAADHRAPFRHVPREWDWVVDDHRSVEEAQLGRLPWLGRYYGAAREHFRPRLGRGFVRGSPPAFAQPESLRLELPAASRRRASARLAGPAIAVMPAGSGRASGYPSRSSWQLILRALGDEFPDTVFVLVGKLRRDERTSSSVSASDLGELLATSPLALDAFDLPLLDQLALVENCRVFISPHTGFGMAALAAGTPWLTLSGGPWHEYFFNGVPFYSVQPDRARYPCYTTFDGVPDLANDNGEGPRTPSMCRARIDEDLLELVTAARMLFDDDLPYQDALEAHFKRLLAAYDGDRSRVWSIGNVHAAYV